MSSYVFYEFKVVAGLVVMEEFGTVGDTPYGRIDDREEGIRILDDGMDMGHDETVGIGHGTGIDLTSADDEAPGIPDRVGNDRGSGRYSGRRSLIRLFNGRNDNHPFRSIKTPGNDNIRAFRKGSSDGFERLAAHYDRTARSRTLEELQVFGNMP